MTRYQFSTTDGAQLVRGQRHTLTAPDGSTFTGESAGVAVEQGVLLAAFRDVTGDVPTKGKDRWYMLPLTALATPRPWLFTDGPVSA